MVPCQSGSRRRSSSKMQQFKIENFLRENPGIPAPKFRPLTDLEVSELVGRLLLKAGSPRGTPQEIMLWFSGHASPIPDIDLDKNEVPLKDLFAKAGITPSSLLYLQWGALRDIDQFKADDLFKYLYEVWYPGADDVEIFDDSLAWMMLLRHYGIVEVWYPVV